MRPFVLLHGGAGSWSGAVDLDAVLHRIEECARRGYAALGGGALAAVEESVACMESSGAFNAGLGAVRNSVGAAELDAGIMDGTRRRAGAVACVRNVPNPVRLARRVMEDTPHVLMVCEGAEDLATKYGLRIPEGSWPGGSGSRDPGTVGAVALDGSGGFAAATSTGGIRGKMPCRVGDSPIPGAGYYADARGAASATGIGEMIMVELVSYRAVEGLKKGPAVAAEEAVKSLEGDFGPGNVGLILLGRGGPAIGLSARLMPVAAASGLGTVSVPAGEVGVEDAAGKIEGLFGR
ncbi:MAG: isoaspartyl peptidase/L-asparaginase [Nitrososphaeria archaeon]